jgi:hypothetical protein
MDELSQYESAPIEKLRDRVIDDLVKHYSLERVSLEEFERRTELISKASTRSELIAQVADLPPLAIEPGERAPRPDHQPRVEASYRIDSASSVRQSDLAVAIFSGSDLKGVWRAPRRLTTLCVFGGSNIDLRKAIIPEDGITISCLCAFGGADIIVPPGLRLTVRGMGIFGGFDRTSNEGDDPDAPTVVVEGIALFGGVSVRVKS